jgi:hypothetical protein
MLNCHWTTWEERYGKIWKDMAKRCGTWSHYIFEKNIIFGWWGSFRLIYTSIYTIQSMSCHVSNGILQPAVNERRALPMAASPSIWPDRIFVRFFSCQAMRKQTGLVGKGHLYGQHNSNTTITHTHTIHTYIWLFFKYIINYFTYIYVYYIYIYCINDKCYTNADVFNISKNVFNQMHTLTHTHTSNPW